MFRDFLGTIFTQPHFLLHTWQWFRTYVVRQG